MPSENIFQMFTRHGGAGFFVKRNSWSHPFTVAQVLSIDGLASPPLPGKPPYYNKPNHRPLQVLAKISYQGATPREEELTSPGTFAYSMIERPSWWPE